MYISYYDGLADVLVLFRKNNKIIGYTLGSFYAIFGYPSLRHIIPASKPYHIATPWLMYWLYLGEPTK